jgi:hypothetical protein
MRRAVPGVYPPVLVNLSRLSRFLSLLSLAAVLFSARLLCPAQQPLTFTIPPVKVPITIQDQQIVVVASGLISLSSRDHNLDIFKLELRADLSDLQQNLTTLLAAQLDKDDRCGERIAIQNATLAPAEPASLATVQLHYERYACAKIMGKQKAQRLVAGNALVPLKLSPAVNDADTELRLVPEVGQIQADGSLGELLRSGALGEMLREKIRASILSALQKGTNFAATLPPAAQGYASIRNAEFQDAGAGRLMVVLDGEIRITKAQVQALSDQLKQRIASH